MRYNKSALKAKRIGEKRKMKQTWKNSVNVAGYVFSTRNLNPRVSKDGTNYISGAVNIAVDEDALNVIPVSFYATETYKNGKPNDTYNVLKQIADGSVQTYQQAGKNAARVRVDGSISTNDFVGRNGDVVSPKQVRGSFIHFDSVSNFCANFDADTVFTSCAERTVEGEEPFQSLRGFVLSYKNAMVPVEFSVRSKEGMKFFDSQDISASNPLVILVKGKIVTNTVEHKTCEEGAFGESVVNTTSRSFQSWDVTFAAREPYEFGDEGAISKDDIKRLVAEREVALERVKDRAANRSNGGFSTQHTPSKKTPAVDGYSIDEYPF